MAETLNVKVENLEEVLKGLDQTKGNAAKAVNATCRDFKSRGPGWVSKAVAQEYTIKASEVKGAFNGAKSIGHLKLGGVSLDNIELEYSGRTLTLSHFRYTPKKPPAFSGKKMLIPAQSSPVGHPIWVMARRAKVIKVEIHKGHKAELIGDYGTTPFIATMGGQTMPFQRRTKDRSSAESIRRTAIPEMITNKKVSEQISKNIDEGLSKRLEHHLERYSNAK